MLHPPLAFMGLIFSAIFSFCCSGRIASISTMAAIVLSIVSVYSMLESGGNIHYPIGGWEIPFGIEIVMFPAQLIFILYILAVSACALYYSSILIKYELLSIQHSNFYALISLYIASCVGIVLSNDIFNVYVFLEISSIVSYALLILSKDNKHAGLDVFNYLVIATISATFYLFAVFLLYSISGDLNITNLSQFIHNNYDNPVIHYAFIFFSLSFLIKIAIMPFSSWLISVYANAPVSVGCIMIAISTKVAIFLFIKLSNDIFGIEFLSKSYLMPVLVYILAPFSILYGSIKALKSDSLVKLLAFSSIAHAGLVIMGLTIFSALSLQSVIFFLIADGIAKSALFMIAGILRFISKDYNLSYLPILKKESFIISCCVIVLLLSIVGFPLTMGFIPKWNLIIESFSHGLYFNFIVIIIGSILSLLYSYRIVEYMFLSKDTEIVLDNEKIKIPHSLYIPIILLTLLVFIIGCFPNVIMQYLNTSIGSSNTLDLYWTFDH